MKKILISTLLVFTFVSMNAQRSVRFWETGAFLGTCNYSGDVNESGDAGKMLNEMRPQFGIFLKRNISSHFNLGAELAYGKVYAEDANHGNAERGYVVNTSLLWANVTADIHFKKFGKYFKRNQNSPYIALGFGALAFSPQLKSGSGIEYPTDVYELHPGTDHTYNLMLGFGWKWRMKESGILSLSFNYHPTGTTHLEGFEEINVAAPSNDSYYGLRLAYSVGFFAN